MGMLTIFVFFYKLFSGSVLFSCTSEEIIGGASREKRILCTTPQTQVSSVHKYSQTQVSSVTELGNKVCTTILVTRVTARKI